MEHRHKIDATTHFDVGSVFQPFVDQFGTDAPKPKIIEISLHKRTPFALKILLLGLEVIFFYLKQNPPLAHRPGLGGLGARAPQDNGGILGGIWGVFFPFPAPVD